MKNIRKVKIMTCVIQHLGKGCKHFNFQDSLHSAISMYNLGNLEGTR